MKLISEQNFESVSPLIEAKSDGTGKNYFLEGIFLQGDITNRNGRCYPIGTLDKEAERFSPLRENLAPGALSQN